MTSREIPSYYYETPKRSFNLESCWRVESKTRQFPFVVASDIPPVVRDHHNKMAADETPSEETATPTPIISYNDLLKGALSGHFVKAPEPTLIDGDDTSNNREDDGTGFRKEASREFLIFHDVEHYLTLKNDYPHCHEIIRCPLNQDFESRFGEKSYRDDLCRGRLIFDFDLEQPLPEMESLCRMKSLASSLNGSQNNQWSDPTLFVPPNFKKIVEDLVLLVFKTYYTGVDTDRLMFIWQISRHSHKFSMHLIVKHAYFSEFWVKQTRIFYCLFCQMATAYQVSSILKAVDLQMARRNATFRILGCSKIGGKPLEIDSCINKGQDLLNTNYPLSIYDCLVGIYHVDQLKQEQCISLDNINYSAIENEVERTKIGEQTAEVKKFRTTIKKQISIAEENKAAINLDDKSIETAVALFDRFNDGTFAIRDQVGIIINLNRLRPAPCPISGVTHENENAYLKLREDGHLIFCCRRGCKNGNFYGHDLGVYRRMDIITGPVIPPKDKGELDEDDIVEVDQDNESPVMIEEKPKIVFVNPQKMAAVAAVQVLMVGVDVENPGGFVRKNPVKAKKATYSRPKKGGAKRVTVINDQIQIPDGLRFPRVK